MHDKYFFAVKAFLEKNVNASIRCVLLILNLVKNVNVYFLLFIFLLRDETLEALSDAQIVAPAGQTVDLQSANHRSSYLYVFDYQTKNGDFPQVCFIQ